MYIDYNKRFLARKMNVGNTCSRHAHKKTAITSAARVKIHTLKTLYIIWRQKYETNNKRNKQ